MEKVLRFEMFPERSLTVLLYRDVTNGGCGEVFPMAAPQ